MTSEDFDHVLDLKIPLERVAVLIGKKGSEKKELESLTKTKMDVDSKEGEITIHSKDPLALMGASEVVRAIGRGFNPDIAKLLVKIDYSLDIINLGDYCKSKNDFVRFKGRIIGQSGKSRNVIEDLTECHICVYGKTVGIIGVMENVPIARRAVMMLLEGAQHASVYKWLERQRRSMKENLKEVL